MKNNKIFISKCFTRLKPIIEESEEDIIKYDTKITEECIHFIDNDNYVFTNEESTYDWYYRYFCFCFYFR